MSDEIAISIICNTYNHEQYIRDALDGFVMQRLTVPFEILVHDDASTDGTADIIREYERKYPKLVKPVYQTENQWQKADGTIIRTQRARAQGKYVAMCEGDDYWTDPLKLQKQYDFMEAHPEYTLCGCSTDWRNELTGKTEKKSKTETDRDISLEDFILAYNSRPFPTVSFFVRAEIWKSLPYFGFPVGDIPLTFYAAANGKVRMLADTMCVYRWFAEGSWTAQNGDEKKRAEVARQMIRGVENFNRFTEYQYDEPLQKRIRMHRYTVALMTHDFDTIKNTDLKEIYQSRSFILRVSDLMRCKMPKLYFFVQRFLGRNQ